MTGTARIALTTEGHHVWCPSVVCWDGRWWLFHSRWPARLGFNAWATHSAIWVAVADRPEGPYGDAVEVLAGAGAGWDADVTHNPCVIAWGGRLWLYYMGNHGPAPRDATATREQWWLHRNAQRVGVADAAHPLGPWRRRERPAFDLGGAPWPVIMVSNPAACADPAGGVRLIVKVVEPGPPPFGGQVRHVVATATAPDAPFAAHPDPVLTLPGVAFTAEDPCLFHAPPWTVIAKDMAGHWTGAGASLARLVSADGVAWRPAAQPLVATLTVPFVDGQRTVERFERPWRLATPDGDRLFAACLADDATSIVTLPLPAG